MKTKTKTLLLLICTLLIGIILGALIHDAFLRNHVKRRFEHMRSSEGFIARFERIIEPTEEQQSALQEILKRHFLKMNRFLHEFPPQMDSLITDLETVLTDEQIKKLKESRMFNRPPHPGKPFPKSPYFRRKARRDSMR